MDSLTLVRLCRKDGDLSKIFLGVFPCDKLPSVSYPACFIANTEPSTSSGEHWVAVFINKEGYGDYFCSYGLPPVFPNFMDKNCYDWNFNQKRIQGTFSTTCGQYCVFFLFCRAKGLPMYKFMSLFTSNYHENDSIVTAFINGKFNVNTLLYDHTMFQ